MVHRCLTTTPVLRREDVARMHETAVAILARTGLAVRHPEVRAELARRAGFALAGERVRIEPACIEAWFDDHLTRQPHPPAPPAAPTPLAAITCGASAYSSWIVTAALDSVRPMTSEDVIAGTKLLHVLQPRGVRSGVPGAPADVHPLLQPLEQYLIGAEYCAAGGSTPLVSHLATAGIIREMDKLYGRDFHHTVWSPSPLAFGGESLDILWHFRTEAAGVAAGSMPSMGVTGPCDPLALMTQAMAEVVGGAAILHALLPGVPVGIFPHPEPADMRSGAMVLGTPEWELLDLMHRDVLAYYHVAWESKLFHTTASLPGAQAQAERSCSALLGVLGGYRHFEAVGMLGLDEVWSPAQLLLDLELLGHAARVGQGDFTGTGLDLGGLPEVVDEVVRGSGSFLGHDTTFANFRAQYHEPVLFQRLGRQRWLDAGRPDAVRAAQHQAEELIGTYAYEPPRDLLQELRRVCEHGRERLGIKE